jgi:hypothetical protein
VRLLLVMMLAACGSGHAPTAGEIVERGWDAHEAVIAAGERAATCADAGAAMQRELRDRRPALAAAIAFDRDPAQLAKLVDFLESHQDRLDELARRTDAVRTRCPDDAGVVTALRDLAVP